MQAQYDQIKQFDLGAWVTRSASQENNLAAQLDE